MDVIQYACPKCGRDQAIAVELAGRRTICSECGTAFPVPKVGAPLPGAMQQAKKKSNAWMIVVLVFVGLLVGFALALPSPKSLSPQPVNATVPAMPESIRSDSLPRGPMTVPSVTPPSRSAAASESTTGETQMVYVAPGGAKVYHKRADCPDMHAKDAVGGMELSAAKSGGYQPCGTCWK